MISKEKNYAANQQTAHRGSVEVLRSKEDVFAQNPVRVGAKQARAHLRYSGTLHGSSEVRNAVGIPSEARKDGSPGD